ncbi:hypothetical protein ACEPAF_1025 [Sanghuangporus sanghuang]
MDWNVVGAFEYDPGTSPDFVYNALGYSVTNLANTAHTFVINWVVDGPDDSMILFDRLIYTAEEDSITSSLASPGLQVFRVQTFRHRNISASGTGLPTLSAPQSTSASAGTSISSNSAATTSSDKSSQVAVVGGSVAGGVAILLVTAIALLSSDGVDVKRQLQAHCYLRPQARRRCQSPPNVVPLTNGLSYRPLPTSTERTQNPHQNEHPQLEKDPFQRYIFDEKQERLPARSRSSPGDRTALSSPWDSTMNGTRTNRATRTEHMLLEHIATTGGGRPTSGSA